MNLLFSSDQLLYNPYPLWKLAFARILSEPNCHLHANDPSEELSIAIQKAYDLPTPPDLVTPDDAARLGGSLLFDLGSSTIPARLKNEAKKKVGFIGVGENLLKKLKLFTDEKYNLIISELLPSELPHGLSDESLKHFLASHYFLPPHTNFFQLKPCPTRKVILFHDSEDDSPSPVDERILAIMDAQEALSVIDISNFDFSSEIQASLIYSLLHDPQKNHALRLASPVPLRLLNHKTNPYHPLRNLHFKESSASSRSLFVSNAKSLRETVSSLIHATTDENDTLDNSPCISANAELDSLLENLLIETNSSAPTQSPLPVPSEFSLSTSIFEAGSGLPAWLTHPGTEPCLRAYVERKDQFPKGPSDFDAFADDALRLIHLTDHKGLYLNQFKALYGEASQQNLKRFETLATKAVATYGTKKPGFIEIHSATALKYARLAFAQHFLHGKHPDFSEQVHLLTHLIDAGKRFHPNGISPEMNRVTLLAMAGNYESALDHCRKQENTSTANPLLAILALCAALANRSDECSAALEAFSPLKAQYASDFMNVSYLVSRLHLKSLETDHTETILLEFEARKPNLDAWLTEILAMALLNVASPDSQAAAILSAEEFLNQSLAFSPGDVEAFRQNRPELPSADLLPRLLSLLEK